MAKQLLKERFQQLAGIKPLYELDESAEIDAASNAWDFTLGKIKDNDKALEYAAKHFGVSKDKLKDRGYNWSAGSESIRRSWYIDVNEQSLEEESRYLKEKIFKKNVDLPIETITPFNRFSERVGVV